MGGLMSWVPVHDGFWPFRRRAMTAMTRDPGDCDRGDCNTMVHMSCARSLFFAFILCLLSWVQIPSFAQEPLDNQPHIQPRAQGSVAAPKPTPKPKPQTQPPEAQPAESQQAQPPLSQEPQVSSSKDSQADFNAAPLAKEPAPAPAVDEKSFQPYDPHVAAKDVEVGYYNFKQRNYRSALDRFNHALLYKPHDAEATFGLALTQEKLDLLSQAYHNYEEYLKIVPTGAHAKEAQEAIKRIGTHVDVQKEPATDTEHDIDVGETYLSLN